MEEKEKSDMGIFWNFHTPHSHWLFLGQNVMRAFSYVLAAIALVFFLLPLLQEAPKILSLVGFLLLGIAIFVKWIDSRKDNVSLN